MSYRLIYVGLGLLVLAVITLGVVLNQEGDPIEVPAPLENVEPAPGTTAIRQAIVEVDLEVGYEADIYVDGAQIAAPVFVPATGVYRWAPSPTSPVMNQWTPGQHTVRVEWQRVAGTPDFGSFEWTFRVH